MRMFGQPSIGDLPDVILSFDDMQQAITRVGVKSNGNDRDVRFWASALTTFVQVHVQSDDTGAGGADYDATNFVSSTRVDCRMSRQQDVTITVDGTHTYWLFLIPVQEHPPGSGNFNVFDGVSHIDDFMTWVDLGS
jgi:hypothetical protein